MPEDKRPENSDVQGEGDYRSGRRFQEEERTFVKSGKVDEKAREAAKAVEGPEGPALEAARKASAEGHADKGSQPPAGEPKRPPA